MLVGERGIEISLRANVLVVGLGGVGGYAAEMLARAGVGSMTLVDADTVSPDQHQQATHSPTLDSGT